MDANQTIGRPITGKSVTVTYTGTAGTTAAVTTDARVVRVVSTTDCYIQIGISPTATSADLFLPAYTPEYFGAQGGVTGTKVSAIQVSTGGSIYVTPF